jgi:hypothetical protein
LAAHAGPAGRRRTLGLGVSADLPELPCGKAGKEWHDGHDERNRQASAF